AQENSELEDELSDAQENSELEDELSDAQESSELEDELLDVQESSELEDELSDAQESSELEDELSDAQENSELEDELFDVQESSELEDELFDVQESSELEDELSDAQENSGLENELLDVQESSELEDELLDVQESSELEDELSDAQENSELEDELSDVQENSELEDESVKVAVDLVDDGANVKHEKIEKPQRKLSVENYFFGLLLEANKEKKYRIIKLNTLPALYLAPEDSCYYFSGTEEELLQYCLVMPKNLNVKVLPRAKFNKALKSESSELQQKDFKSLISYAVIHVSQGQLLDGHSAKQGLVLSSMPDVEKNSILSRYKGIAEHMYQQEGSLFDVAETLQVSLADVFDFYNLCYLLGYVKMTTTDAKDLETDNTKTLGRFLKSFFTK
ncbi:MAG: hypothetical protein GQ583_06065, partial [Methyloprofundus sp.]|nr:hypothetical protein [Methyloprofundus sp.]